MRGEHICIRLYLSLLSALSKNMYKPLHFIDTYTFWLTKYRAFEHNNPKLNTTCCLLMMVTTFAIVYTPPSEIGKTQWGIHWIPPEKSPFATSSMDGGSSLSAWVTTHLDHCFHVLSFTLLPQLESLRYVPVILFNARMIINGGVFAILSIPEQKCEWEIQNCLSDSTHVEALTEELQDTLLHTK